MYVRVCVWQATVSFNNYSLCSFVQGGRSRASDSFVKKMMHSEFTLAASNDIKNATGRDKTLDLAVVFFTNRVMGSPPRSPIVGRAIELAQDRLDEHSQKMQAATKAAMGKGFKLAGVRCLPCSCPSLVLR